MFKSALRSWNNYKSIKLKSVYFYSNIRVLLPTDKRMKLNKRNNKRNHLRIGPACTKGWDKITKTMSWCESYLTFLDQKDANACFYTRVGTLKYLITKPVENQVNIVTMLVTRIIAWKSWNQRKVLFLCLVLYMAPLKESYYFTKSTK